MQIPTAKTKTRNLTFSSLNRHKRAKENEQTKDQNETQEHQNQLMQMFLGKQMKIIFDGI